MGDAADDGGCCRENGYGEGRGEHFYILMILLVHLWLQQIF